MRSRDASAAALLLPLCLLQLRQTGAEPLDLAHRRLIFAEDFSRLSVSPHGPGTRWVAHTPWGGDFGDAAFADPRPGFPFSHAHGMFRIELRRDPAGKWQSGLLASEDSDGQGFGFQYGYAEMRARFPAGPGVWPAFWLDSMPPKNSADPSLEVDIVEHYGKFPAAFNSTVTVWPKTDHDRRQSSMHINAVQAGTLSTGFHSYGVDIGPRWIIFYFDRRETWRVPTPPSHKHKLMILLDLGLGGGWPITNAPNPAWMDVDYVKAWSQAGQR